MKFLYSENANGVLSSLTGSWLFWIVVVLVILVTIVLVVSLNKNLQQKLKVEQYFNDNGQSNATQDNIEEIHRDLLHEINTGNSSEKIPDFNKYLDEDIDKETAKGAQPFGLSDTDKSVKSVYHVSSKKENLFKIASDEIPENVCFKIELHDLSKVSFNPQTTTSEMKLYNEKYKCIAIFKIDTKFITIQSISPYIDDITISIENPVRLLVFTQKSNDLYLDTKKIAKFSIYDKITYFYIKSPIIKELQYFENKN